jgi:type II secretory pathway pseudopilin PulG
MLSGTRLQDRAWGPSVDGSAGRLGGARRMAVTGVLAALVIPLLLPSMSVNVLARATHHNGGGDGTGNGKGGQIVLSNMASLRGSLQRPKPVQLFQVKVDAGIPFYVRQEVDDEFADDGWRPSGRYGQQDNLVQLNQGLFDVGPFENPPAQPPAKKYEARFTLLALGGRTLPILSNPSSLQSPGGGVWNSATASVQDATLRRGMTYTEVTSEPAPTQDQLRNAAPWVGDEDTQARLVGLPPNMPQSVKDQTDQLVAGLDNPYDKAKAISDFFTNGKNGFEYSLTTSDGGGRNALEVFLDADTGRKGFCQQYAAAAGVMMRMAGLPTRVVIGYTHQPPDSNGLFTVLTSDAHAWVEVYFSGIGWIPFDPTPLVGGEATRAVNLPWAAHPQANAQETAEPTANRGLSASASAASGQATQASDGGSSFGVSTVMVEIGLLVVLAIVLILALIFGPRWLRTRQRRRRLERARATGNPEPLWLELAATATDRDALWPSTVTVGQVAGWLSRHGVDERGRAAVTAVADRVERDRFSAQLVQELPADSIAALDQALTRWARRTDRRLSLLHRWLPRSLVSGQPRWRR